MPKHYYNEFGPYAAQWLRNLIAAGHLPRGDVDERSIVDVAPSDLVGYTQCHFFAGIGGWSLALRLAGWPDDREAWTGSCPCQPFSVIGKKRGVEDERHLWPNFFGLIEVRRPATVYGEQVASKDGRDWLVGVRADLESAGYAVGAADLCSAGVSAPHIRQRIYWVGDADYEGLEGHAGHVNDRGAGRVRLDQLPRQAARYLGTPSTRSLTKTERPVASNPELHRWLIGFPRTWGCCAPTGTQ